MVRKPVQDFFLFLLGSALFAAGIFLFTNQVVISSGFGWGWGGGYRGWFGGFFPFGTGGGFGLLMVPFGIGVALLIADTYRKVGWFLVWAASAALGAAVLQSLLFSFRPISLWSLMSMIVMVGAGAGLMFKSLRDYQEEDRKSRRSDVDEVTKNYSKIKEELDQLKAKVDKDFKS